MVQSIEDARRRQAAGGRVPPHNLEAEESLLGAMLLSKDAVVAAVEVVDADDFYKPAHGHIFSAITSLWAQGESADAVTISEELRRAGLLESTGGHQTLVALQARTPAISNATGYAHIVEEHALLRRLIGVAGEIADLGYDVPDDVTAAVDRAEMLVFEVAQRRTSDTTSHIRDLLDASLDRLEALFGRNESITGVPTGYTDLDERLAGLQPSNFVIIGARPAMGKTAFALGMAAHAALEANTPVLFFSLEMSHLELTQRLLCAEARVDATRMRNGRLHESDWGKISHAVGRLAEAPIYIDDNPHLTIMEIRAKSRRMKSRTGLGLVVLDYLQLMTGRTNAENRQVEVSEMSRGLKILARELEVPVVALSQLSRNLEMRQDKRPQLADLRESGCMPASTRLMRADNGEEVTLGELVLSQEQPLVWSLDEHWRFVPRRLLKTFPSGVKPVFRLRLASGREVDATANHSFRTVKGWMRLDQLDRGDFLAVPRRIPPPVQAAGRWDDDELVLLAHLLGDGSIGPSSVKYATSDPANKVAVEDAARRRFGIEVVGEKRGNTWQLWFPAPYHLTHHRRHPVRNWAEPLGVWGSRSHNKFVPPGVFGLPDDQVAFFLHHLWATDGSITLRRNRRNRYVSVFYASTSRRLAEDVCRLLLRLDIPARVSRARKSGYRDSWHATVSGVVALTRFLTTVGAHGARGECVPEALDVLSTIKENPNTGAPDLLALATSDVLWDEIVEVTTIGAQPTFDATIDDTHNFVANSVVAHNSLEQDADVVMFLYRDEMYHQDTADRGMAEVIVAKHRNGPTGVTNLSFVDRYTRFMNLARGV